MSFGAGFDKETISYLLFFLSSRQAIINDAYIIY